MSFAAKNAVNLNVLRRHDPSIAAIVAESSHCVVYDFDQASQQWNKRGVEGTMFVFQRTSFPPFGLFVMNRLGPNNYVVDLNKNLDVQLLAEYVIFQNSQEDSITGLWLYESEDRPRIAKVMSDCILQTPEADVSSVTSAAQSSITSAQGQTLGQQFGQQVDVASLFKKSTAAPNTTAPVGSPRFGKSIPVSALFGTAPDTPSSRDTPSPALSANPLKAMLGIPISSQTLPSTSSITSSPIITPNTQPHSQISSPPSSFTLPDLFAHLLSLPPSIPNISSASLSEDELIGRLVFAVKNDRMTRSKVYDAFCSWADSQSTRR